MNKYTDRMNKYAETKKKLDDIRNRPQYASCYEMIFRTAITSLFDAGFDNFRGDEYLHECESEINARYDRYKEMNQPIFFTREFELAILHCAWEIAQVDTSSVIMYLQREFPWNLEECPNYQRIIRTVQDCITLIDEMGSCEDAELLFNLQENVGLTDAEIKFYGYEYLLKKKGEEE